MYKKLKRGIITHEKEECCGSSNLLFWLCLTANSYAVGSVDVE